MNDHYNLTQGNILEKLLKVSIPVILTSLVQMAYNLTDLLFLGRISSDSVAAAGIGGQFIWLGAAFIFLARVGTEVRVAQNTGRADHENAKLYAKTGIQVEIILGLIYALAIFAFAEFWISFYNILPEDYLVEEAAITYTRIISIGLPFYMLNPVLSGSMNGTGNTKIPFLISSSGLIINAALDPLFIFAFKMGVTGAAIATVIAQISVTIVFVIYTFRRESILSKIKIIDRIDWKKAWDILRLGFPAAAQSAIFTLIAMYLSRLVTPYSTDANAVQKIGSQIESLSWLVAGGIQTGLGAFVGQNYGGMHYNRVLKGVKYTLVTMSIYGIVITLALYLFPEFLFSIFLSDKATLPLGVDYLKILAFSQLFMIIESTISGAFNGLGKTKPASLVGIAFNLARIPMALFLMPIYGLNGMWWALTISSVFKGLVLYIWFKLYVRTNINFKFLELSKG